MRSCVCPSIKGSACLLCRLIEQLGMLLATHAHNFHNQTGQQVSRGEGEVEGPRRRRVSNVFLLNEQNESRPRRFFLLSVFLCASITFFIISHIVKFIGCDGWQFSRTFPAKSASTIIDFRSIGSASNSASQSAQGDVLLCLWSHFPLIERYLA